LGACLSAFGSSGTGCFGTISRLRRYDFPFAPWRGTYEGKIPFRALLLFPILWKGEKIALIF
jgi:hypothetical protein